MKLALIGKSITHSKSPYLYRKILGEDTVYDLIDVDSDKLPSLESLATKYDGINITSPYKEKYFNQVTVEDKVVRSLGAINTIDLRYGEFRATNTDLLAVREILKGYQRRFPKLQIVLLGSGAMSRVVSLASEELSIPILAISRKSNPDMSNMDLKPPEGTLGQNLVINACSRDFFFQGTIDSNTIFWDLNYQFLPHQNTLPFLVKEYHDGQEMLYLQAKAAVEFWKVSK